MSVHGRGRAAHRARPGRPHDGAAPRRARPGGGRDYRPGETTFTFNGLQPLLVTDDGSAPQQHYTYGAGATLLVCDDAHEGPQVALHEALRSVVGLMRPDRRLQGRTQ